MADFPRNYILAHSSVKKKHVLSFCADMRAICFAAKKGRTPSTEGTFSLLILEF